MITLVRIDGGKARIGISAPSHVPILREELVERDRRLDWDERQGDAGEQRGPR